MYQQQCVTTAMMNMNCPQYVVGQPIYYTTQQTVPVRKDKKRFFTLQQSDQPSELAEDNPLSACRQIQLTTFICRNIRTCGPIFEKMVN